MYIHLPLQNNAAHSLFTNENIFKIIFTKRAAIVISDKYMLTVRIIYCKAFIVKLHILLADKDINGKGGW